MVMYIYCSGSKWVWGVMWVAIKLYKAQLSILDAGGLEFDSGGGVFDFLFTVLT